MVPGGASELVERVAAAACGADDLSAAKAGLAALRRLRSWCDARDVELTAMVSRCTPAPEPHVKDAGKLSEREARQRAERARTASALPALGEALGEGEIRGEHLDAAGRARARLTPAEQERFDANGERLALLARGNDPATFAKLAEQEAQRVRERDGEDELARQRRAARCRTWADRDTGMWVMRLQVDPLTGVKLDTLIRTSLESMFNESTPETAPTDPFEKQDHLRALAATALLTGEGVNRTTGPPEVIVVVDTRCTAHHADAGPDEASSAGAGSTDTDSADGHDPCAPGEHRPSIDWGLPVELPPSVLAELYPRATVTTVVLCRGAVIHAPGRLNLGRTTRLANRAQRRVLRALYPGCAIPGCTARFDHCKIHHVVWWRHGGFTDLDNLLPLCFHHHDLVHHHGWQLHLRPDRTLTVSRPDGTRQSTGPPSRRAA